MRLLLAALLLVGGRARAQEPAFDALTELFARETPQDAAAARALPERGETLASVSADLTLAAQGLEAFRSSDDAERALKHSIERVPPELRSRFASRRQALDALYRTLAVTDYTWATRFPGENCSALDWRARLLASPDGLFKDPETGAASPWVVHLLGPDALKGVEKALDRASSGENAKGRAYELLRAKAAKATAALEAAPEDKRAWLYCLRAEAYEGLARANQVSEGPIAASRAAIPSRGVALIGKTKDGVFEAHGAGVLITTKAGVRIVTDAKVVGDGEGYQAAFPDRGAPIPVTVERRGETLAVLSAAQDLGEGRAFAEADPAKDDLVTVVAHSERLGAWAWTQGLVSAAQDGSFQTDAAVDAAQAGGAVLDENGRLAGLLTLRQAQAEDGEGQWPVGVPASALKAWLDGGELQTAGLPIMLQDAGTSAILGIPGAGASMAGLPGSVGGVNWNGGGGVGNWRPRSSAGPPAFSRGGSSSYSGGSSSNPGAEALGRAMGEALGQGVRALFKGLGSMFRSKDNGFKPRRSSPSRSTVVKTEKAKPVEKPKEPELPPLELKLAMTVQDSPDAVHFTARVTSNRPDAKLGGLFVDFEVNGSTKPWARTNDAGYAFLTVHKPRAQKAHDDLEAESGKHPWLTNASNKTDRQSYCEATLYGAALVIGAVAVLRAPLAVPAAGGAMLNPATRPQAVKACQVISQGAAAAAGTACGAFFGEEIAKGAAPTPRGETAEALPPVRGVDPRPKQATKAAVEADARGAHDELSRIAREMEAQDGGADDGAMGQPADPGEQPPGDDPDSRDAHRRMTGREAEEEARRLGFEYRVSPQKSPFNSHGQPVFRRGNKFITPDVDGHRGGAWKMFDRFGRRLGTYDKYLNRIGD